VTGAVGLPNLDMGRCSSLCVRGNAPPNGGAEVFCVPARKARADIALERLVEMGAIGSACQRMPA